MEEEQNRIRLASMKRQHYETGITVMESIAKALVRAMLEREKCRVVVEYDPTQDGLQIIKELAES